MILIVFSGGSHDRAPSHEVYAYVPYSGHSVKLLHSSNEGFRHLWGVYPQKVWSKSV